MQLSYKTSEFRPMTSKSSILNTILRKDSYSNSKCIRRKHVIQTDEPQETVTRFGNINIQEVTETMLIGDMLHSNCID
jgi:hypothetical protein